MPGHRGAFYPSLEFIDQWNVFLARMKVNSYNMLMAMAA